jgi:hypothetical protein
MQCSCTVRRSIAGLALAAITVASGATGPSSCPTGTGVMVLVDQESLYLDRPSHRGSISQSIWTSLLLTAATGGSYVIGMWPGNDPGVLFLAPAGIASDLQPAAVSRSLVLALSAIPAAARMDMLATANHGNEADEVLDHTTCQRVLVLRSMYRLEQVDRAVQLSLTTQVIETSPTTYEKTTVAAL